MKKKNNYILKKSLPKEIKIKQIGSILIFSGPLGNNTLNLKKIDKKGYGIFFLNTEKKQILFSTQSKSFFGTITNIIENKIQGVSRGFLLYLRIIGIGFRATLDKNILTFKIGLSHDVKFFIPGSIRVFLVEPTLICLYGIDLNQLTQTAAKIRNIKPPSAYKGKGIRLFDEIVHVKQAKQK